MCACVDVYTYYFLPHIASVFLYFLGYTEHFHNSCFHILVVKTVKGNRCYTTCR